MGQMPRRPADARGFTLIELVVTIALIAMAACGLVRAAQVSRESARRAQCSNNLRQIGEALANYASEHLTFPPGAILQNASDAGNNCGNRDDVSYGNPRDFTAFAMLLGQTEGQEAYNSINFELRAGGGEAPLPHAGASNFTGLSVRVAAYVCPSDSQCPPVRLSNPYSQTSYFPSGGTWNTIGYYTGPKCWKPSPGNGAFDGLIGYAPAAFTDGTGQTIAVGEASRFRGDSDPQFNQWSRFGYFLAAVDPSNRTSRPQGLGFEVPRINAGFHINDYAELPPGTVWPDDSDYKAWLKNIVLYKEFGQWGFRSQHRGGANFLYADGSVHFLKTSIDHATYQAHGTRAGKDETSGAID